MLSGAYIKLGGITLETITVNWVEEDEELLEPYEWNEYDEIEKIEDYEIYRIDDKTLYDFIYGCMVVKRATCKTWVVGNGHYCLALQFDQSGTLKKRSLLLYQDRIWLLYNMKQKPVTTFEYHVYDEAYMKEYGLTRKERMKKQCLDEMIDEIYLNDSEVFHQICDQLGMEEKRDVDCYLCLKEKLEKGYHFIHELLYNQLIKK